LVDAGIDLDHLNSGSGMSVIFTVYGLPRVAPGLKPIIIIRFKGVGKKIAQKLAQ
jgi:hypothetical protein